METLTYDRALALLEEIVAEKGADYVYTEDPVTIEKQGGHTACFYAAADSSTPGCIIGHLIHQLNPDTNLNHLDGYGAIGAINSAGYLVELYSKTGRLLVNVQNRQDSGSSWGDSLARAKSFAEAI